MAYVTPNLDDEEDKKKTPTLSGGDAGPTMMGGETSSTGMPQKQQTPQQQKGTGFVNLSDWLGAGGNQRAQSIQNMSKSLLGNEQTDVDKAKKPLADASYTAQTINGGDVYGAIGNNDASKLSGALNQDYTGPMTVAYDAHASKNLQDEEALKHANQIGSVVANPEAESGHYSAGLRALDSALFGADPNAVAASQQAGKDLDAFVAKTGADIKALEDKAQGFKTEAQKARDAAAGVISGVQGDINHTIDQRVSDAKIKEQQDADAAKQGLYWSEADQGYRRLAPGQMIGQTTGGGASRNNLVTSQESRGLDMLDKLIGGGGTQKTGDYQAQHTGAVTDPNYQAPGTDFGGHPPRAGTVMSMLPGDINDSTSPKGMYKDAYMKFSSDYTAKYGRNPDPNDPELVAFMQKFAADHPEIKFPRGDEADAYERNQKTKSDPRAVAAYYAKHPQQVTQQARNVRTLRRG